MTPSLARAIRLWWRSTQPSLESSIGGVDNSDLDDIPDADLTPSERAIRDDEHRRTAIALKGLG